MLPRRSVLPGVASLATAAFVPRRARAASERILRLGYLLSNDSQLGAGAAAMAAELARRTGDRFQIRQFPDASLGDEVEMLKAVQLGTLDLAFITGASLPNILPEAGIFDIPFLFTSPEQARIVLGGPIGDEYRQRFAAKDLVALAWGENGLRHITNARHAVTTPDSLRGLKLRLPQSDVMMAGFRALGADVAPLPFPQLYDSLRTGTFDGQENPIATILAAKLHQVQKFLTLSGHVYDPALLVMAPDVFDNLSAAEKAHFNAAARLGATASREFARRAEENGIATLQAQGMQIVTEVDRTQFAAAMASATPAFESRFGRSEIDRIRNTT
jgi:tripartite ATP-independent transporter DctP family solute receptor